MTRLPMLCLLPYLVIIFFSGCGGDDQPGRPVAPPADSMDNRAWDLAQDRWNEKIETLKKRIPEAEAGRKNISGDKGEIKVKITDEGYPSEATTYDRADLPDKVVLAAIKLNVVEKSGGQDSRELDYTIVYLWDGTRWDFFEGTALLTKSILPDTGKPGEKVGQAIRLESDADGANLVWLFGPPLSEAAKASLGLEAEPPSSQKSAEKGGAS